MGRSSEVSASICDGSGVWDQNGTHSGRPDGRARSASVLETLCQGLPRGVEEA